MTAAAMARAVSNPLTLRAAGAAAAGAGRAVEVGAGAGRATDAAVPPVGGRGGGGAALAGRGGAAGPAAGGTAGAPACATAAAAGGAPAGKVGNLIVAVGLGGRLIRTVSFFGWTLAASGGLGGTPPGGFGGFSAIKFIGGLNLKATRAGVKPLFPARRTDAKKTRAEHTACVQPAGDPLN